MNIEKENSVDLFGGKPCGFKKCKSTNTAGLVIQSIISRLLDENNYILMSSVGLTDAFDLVDVEHLTKHYTLLACQDIL
jgi:hypothetical protein